MSLYAMGISIILLVDLGGFAPPSRTLFLITVYAVLYSIYLFGLFVNHHVGQTIQLTSIQTLGRVYNLAGP